MLRAGLPATRYLEGIAGISFHIIDAPPPGAALHAGEKEETPPQPGRVEDQSHRGDGSRTDGRTDHKPPPPSPRKKPGLY
jgi:hypothetical protein